MKLICLTGIDGAGKTTLAQNLVQALRDEGVPARYVYGRTVPVISRLLMALGRATLLRRTAQWQDYQTYAANKRSTMRNPLLAGVYQVAILTDYYVQIWGKLLPHLLRRRVIVCDRYLYDTVISDLAAHLNYTRRQALQAIDTGLRLLPMPSATILLDLPEEVAFARKNDMPHVDYLRERRGYYLQLQKRPEVMHLSGEQPPDALVATVMVRLTGALAGEVVS